MEVLNHLFAFLSVTLLLSASPGPVMINCMSDAAHYGLKKTLLSMLGISLGNLIMIMF
jgi:homoserine/homoserine lactone efflux protein